MLKRLFALFLYCFIFLTVIFSSNIVGKGQGETKELAIEKARLDVASKLDINLNSVSFSTLDATSDATLSNDVKYLEIMLLGVNEKFGKIPDGGGTGLNVLFQTLQY